MAIDAGNNYPGKSILTALENSSPTKVLARLKQFHTFGPPCFILGSKLCHKKLNPKWTPCSRQTVYLGILLQHAGSVSLILDIKTGYMSKQLLIIFYDDITTTSARKTKKILDNWDDIFNNYRELPQEEFQFIIGKKWKFLTYRSGG